MTSGNCDTSPIVLNNAGGAYVSIDGSQLLPSPFVSMQIEKYKMDSTIIGGLLRVTLSGYIVGSNFDAVSSGILAILTKAKKSDCINIVINCSNTFINGWGRITDLNIDQGNHPTWVNIAPYSVTIEVYENNNQLIVEPDNVLVNSSGSIGNVCLYTMNEQVSLSVNEDSFNWGTLNGSSYYFGNRHAKASFSISAGGITGGCTSNFIYGLEAAETVIINRLNHLKKLDLNALNTENLKSNILTDDIKDYTDGFSYLEFRSVEINTLANSVTVNGDIIYRPDCAFPNVFTEINIEESLDSDGVVLTLNGTITGLIDSTYTSIIDNADIRNCNFNDKLDAAQSFLDVLVDNDYSVLYNIVNNYISNTYLPDSCITSSGVSPTDICPNPSGSPDTSPELCSLRIVSSQINRNPSSGQISFTFVFNNKQNCSIPGAKRVDIEINHDIPHDNVVEILIPGRGDKGPLIQSLCAKSSEKYTITINATLNTSRCNWKNLTETDSIQTCADALLSNTETDLGINCWFITDHQETKGNSTYRLTKTYLKPSCV